MRGGPIPREQRAVGPESASDLPPTLADALHSDAPSTGSTHGFYLYPARFSPDFARTVIATFSHPGDVVLDPFMGGGTSIIEGLSLGRFMVGTDLNSLAHFISTVRTRPLSLNDEEAIGKWASRVARDLKHPRMRKTAPPPPPSIRNLPLPVRSALLVAARRTDQLKFPRQREFARAVLLRLVQLTLDCRDHPPTRRELADRLCPLTEAMIAGLRDLVRLCARSGVSKREIAGRRLLLCRDAVSLEDDPRICALEIRPRLVLTSPPYPRVHVLYHRWQVRGRRETPAPYWITQVPDGHYASYYTGGSRTVSGEEHYFSMIKEAFSSIRRLVAQDALVVQLIGFADAPRQFPRYLDAMRDAGFDEWRPPAAKTTRLRRHVPHRKWHAKLQRCADASREFLLFHRLRRV